jgi:tripartite-type tricarboxylate transporter receptor subunit TctC
MKRFSRRALLSAIPTAAAVSAKAQTGWAPSRPLRLIVGFAAGGPADVVARDLAQQMQATFGQSIVVENTSGGTGVIAINTVSRAPADGHTVFLAASGNVVLQPLVSPGRVDVSRLAPVSLVSTSPHLMVSTATLPARNIQEFIAYAKAHKGEMSFASAGTGGLAHLGAELFQSIAGVEGVHVPYRGTGALTNDLVAGRVHAAFSSIPSLLPLVEAGQLRALGVTAPTDAAGVRGVPVLEREGLPGFRYTTWYGLYVPSGTPAAAVAGLNSAIHTAVADPGFRQRMEPQGIELSASTPEALTVLMKEEADRWRVVIASRNITIE